MNVSESLQWNTDSLFFLASEGVVLIGFLLILIAGLIPSLSGFRFLKTIFLVTMVVATFTTFYSWPVDPLTLFGGLLRTDDFGSFFKIIFYAGAFITGWMTSPSQRRYHEYFLLVMAAVMGSGWLVMSFSLITLILSLEIVSICGYVLTGFLFTKSGAEGSLKYFLMGSAFTALMIYGASLLYGYTGTFDFSSESFFHQITTGPERLVLIGGFLVLGGMIIKIAAAPLHFWAPDAYEGAPTPVVAFFSVVPKLAGFAILCRFTLALHSFGQSPVSWQEILVGLAIASMGIGNFAALAQKKPKRLLAYSSVAQTGFMLLALACLRLESIHALLFYAIVFAIGNFLVFLALQTWEDEHGCTDISSFAGKGKHALVLSVGISIGLLSLTGLPPLAGFTAKLFLFTQVWGVADQTQDNLLYLAFGFGLLNTVISLFFYLRIPFFLFFRSQGSEPIGSPETKLSTSLLVALLAIALIALFLRPDALTGWINRVTFVL